MNAFTIIRRALWAIILTGCVVVGCLYLAISQTFLTTTGLTRIIQSSNLAETVKNDVLLPKVLASTRSSDYSSLLDDKTVTEAFNSAVTTDMLNAKLAPAIDALQLWLNSKEPSITFSVSMSDVSDAFAAKLTEAIKTKLATLPECTRQNTLADAETGRCQSPFITTALLSTKIDQAIQSDAELQQNATLTEETVPLAALDRSASDLPSYLNMFYAFSLVAAGIGLLITLWLLAKHRFAGIITIGVAALLAATILFVGSILASSAVRLGEDPLMSKIIFTATQLFGSAIQQEALWLAGGGVVAVIIGTVFIIVFKRRRKSRETMHTSSETPAPSDERPSRT